MLPACEVHHPSGVGVDPNDGVEAKGAKTCGPHTQCSPKVVWFTIPHPLLTEIDEHKISQGVIDGPVPVAAHPRNHLLLIKRVLNGTHSVRNESQIVIGTECGSGIHDDLKLNT